MTRSSFMSIKFNLFNLNASNEEKKNSGQMYFSSSPSVHAFACVSFSHTVLSSICFFLLFDARSCRRYFLSRKISYHVPRTYSAHRTIFIHAYRHQEIKEERKKLRYIGPAEVEAETICMSEEYCKSAYLVRTIYRVR